MNKKLMIASTSTVYGGSYLEYLKDELESFLQGVETLVFIPYACPGGITHDQYTNRAQEFFTELNITVRGIHSFEDPHEAIENAQAIFTGGGNTFLLVSKLYEMDLMGTLRQAINNGTRYIGTSAGSNITGISMQTTNDMPIVYPPSFNTLGVIPFNINPHYLDPQEGLKHMGETRETRIMEFHTQNKVPVVGLREGSWLSVNGDEIILKGELTARIFQKDKSPYELPSGEKVSFV